MPEARLVTLPKTFTSSKGTRRLHSTRPRKNGYMGIAGYVKGAGGEREFVVDSGPSMQMVSKRDLNPAELETMRIWRSHSTVMTDKFEVQTREEATLHVKEIDLFVTVLFLEETLAVLSVRKLCEDDGFPTTEPAVKNHISPEKGKRIN